MSDMETYIAEAMAKIRAAVANAPSHEEIFAAFEAMLSHLLTAPKETLLTAKKDAPSAATPANDTTPPDATT